MHVNVYGFWSCKNGILLSNGFCFLKTSVKVQPTMKRNLIRKVDKLITEMEMERDDLTCIGKG